ncbi:MAG: histidine phosphatase family protein [Actinomycetota bacterium]
MPSLYLLRHAKSSWDDPAVADRDRPLAPRGRSAAQAIARHIAAAGIRPNLVLCSPAQRTRQTLKIIAAALGPQAKALIEEELYGADATTMAQRLRSLPSDLDAAMVIGHNPGIQALAIRLAGPQGSQRLVGKFPTGALVTLEIPGDWGQLGAMPAPLLGFLVPRDM